MAIFTQEDHDALLKAIGQGAKRVKYADKEVEYKSNSEMLEALRIIKADLGLDRGGRANGVFDKGLRGCDETDSEYFD